MLRAAADRVLARVPNLKSLLRYLIGDRLAILAFAADRRTLPLSFVFVLSAALARRYDGADFVAEPEALLLPALVSWFNATVLFLLLHVLIGRRCDPRPDFLASYRVVLSLFWLTAPLAWLYAIPVERFLDPYDATVANLWLLLIVAGWRVALMSRVVSVMYGIAGWRGFYQVMFFADCVAVGLMLVSPKPIVSIMAGIAHTEKDSLILEVTLGILFLGSLTLPVWLILMLVSALRARGAWQVAEGDTAAAGGAMGGLWALAVLSILVWLPILPFTQAEQRLGRQVDDALASGRIGDALDLMSSRPRDDFPPHFDPRPNHWPGRTSPDVLEVMPVLTERQVPDWVREAYLVKLDLRLWSGWIEPEQAKMLVGLRGRIEGVDEVLEDHREMIEGVLQQATGS